MEIDLNKLAKQYGHLVSAISHRMIHNHSVAQEASQEVWYEITKSIHSYKGDSELSTWIYTIAKRTILKYAKNEKTATILELEEFRSLPEIDYYGTEDDKKEWIKKRCDWCLTALIHCLDNESRLIFILKENLRLPYKQISEIMDVKEENVRKIRSRSIQKISNFMTDTCPLYNPNGSCKCRIQKQIFSIDLDKEYLKINKIIRLVDLYQRFEKELPRKNYWIKFLT